MWSLPQIGIYTLYCILDTLVIEDFEAQLAQLLQLFGKTLNDPENLGIRIITLRALGKIAEYVSAEDKADVAAIQALVPNMVAVLGQALEADDGDGIKHGFDVLETLLYIVSKKKQKNTYLITTFRVAYFVDTMSNASL